jgi:hypothetical protein
MNGRDVPIMLQKSKVEERQIFRENTKREAIADSYKNDFCNTICQEPT